MLLKAVFGHPLMTNYKTFGRMDRGKFLQAFATVCLAVDSVLPFYFPLLIRICSRYTYGCIRLVRICKQNLSMYLSDLDLIGLWQIGT